MAAVARWFRYATCGRYSTGNMPTRLIGLHMGWSLMLWTSVTNCDCDISNRGPVNPEMHPCGDCMSHKATGDFVTY